MTEDQVASDLDWLGRNAQKIAQARASRVFLEEHRHTVKALAMKESKETTAAAQERDAYSSKAYQDHIKLIENAVFEDERLRVYQKAIESRFEFWRSMCANARVQGKV